VRSEEGKAVNSLRIGNFRRISEYRGVEEAGFQRGLQGYLTGNADLIYNTRLPLSNPNLSCPNLSSRKI